MNLPGFSAEAALAYSPRYGEQGAALSMPCIYGRWCGPGCGGPGGPKDDVDACCKAHDECYDRRGYFACSCDRTLLDCIRPKMSIWTAKGRAAIAVYGWFSTSPCNPWA